MIASIIGNELMYELKNDKSLRPRVNLHDSPHDPVQKMVYVMRQGEERKPHANARELTQIVLEGDGDLIIYDDTGEEVERYHIGPAAIFCYTLPPGTYHTKQVHSELMVFFEVMKGPYVAGDVTELGAV